MRPAHVASLLAAGLLAASAALPVVQASAAGMRPELTRSQIVRVLDSVLDSSLRAWSSGRSSIRDVRRALSDAVALVLPAGDGTAADPGLAALRALPQ